MDNKILPKQLSLIIFSFLCANTLMKGYSVSGGSLGWLALILACVFGVLLSLLPFKLSKIYPNLSFFEILQRVWGVFLSKVFALMYGIFCFLDSGAVGGYMISFVKTMSPLERLSIPFGILLFFCCIWFCKSKIKTIGGVMQIIVPILIFLFALCLIFALVFADVKEYNFSFITEKGSFLKAVISFILVPFCSIILLFPFIKDTKKIKPKNIILPTVFAGIFLSVSYLLNSLILGEYVISIMNFPSYMALSVLNISSFFQRIEIFLFGAFILCDALRFFIGAKFCINAFSFVFPKIKNLWLWVIPFGITLISFFVFKETDEILNTSLSDIWVFSIMLIIIPLFSLAIGQIKRLRIEKGKKL